MDAAPAIIKGLTDLKTGLESAGRGLTSLQTLAGSQEYGYLQNSIGANQLGFMVTPDIPDIPQLAQTEQTFVAPAAGTITTQYGIRGNETDGTGTVGGAAANCGITMINTTPATPQTPPSVPVVSTQALTPVLTDATLASTAPSAGAILAGTDAPQTGPTLAVAAGDVYTIKMTCVDSTPISEADPGA